jgi:hypothetical protein
MFCLNKMLAPRKRDGRRHAFLKIVAALAFFSIVVALGCFRPAGASPKYIKAVNYFGKSWPITFWNSDLSEVSADFHEIQQDGFNSIILIVPWGEFQPGLDPIRFNDDAYRRLTLVCSQAHAAGLKVFMRVSYTFDFYPGVQLPYTLRTNALIGGTSLIPAWDSYLAKINAATQGCGDGAFITWEDYWDVIWKGEQLRTAQERAAYSKQSGYSTWIDRHADNAYKARYAADLGKFGAYPIPKRDNPDFEMVFLYFDDQMMNKLLPVLAKNFRQATVEARTDGDPIYDGNELLKWYSHTNNFTVTSSDYLMTYWGPGTGADNKGGTESSKKVVDRFNYLQRKLLAQTPNQIFIEQWLFKDNTPQFHSNTQINPAELSGFIRDSARPLAQFTAGYALWNWRDYRASTLFNGFFSLGNLGWDFSPGAGIQQLSDGPYARLSQGQFIRQDVPRVRDFYREFAEKLHLRFTARGEGRVAVHVGAASQEINIQGARSARVITMEFPAPSGEDPNLVITALSGTVELKDLYLYSFEQISNVRFSDNSPGDHYRDIVALNQKLDDPQIVVSSIRASNDTINYLAGAEHPESDGQEGIAWVGPNAKVKLYPAAPTIEINGYMNLEIFRKAKLFPAGCTLAAWINGKSISQTLFTESQPIAMKVPVPPESHGAVTLELKNNCSLIPKAVGLGSDVRTLSFMISGIQAEKSGGP